MKRIRVTNREITVDGRVESITVDGATLAAAVRKAVRALGLGSGRTLGAPERLAAGEWRWNWSGHLLDVHEIRPSGPSGPAISRAERTRRKLEISLSDEAHARLRELAEPSGNRSAVVERLVLAARD